MSFRISCYIWYIVFVRILLHLLLYNLRQLKGDMVTPVIKC